MNIFIDIDDTLFQTGRVMKSNAVAHILSAELESPLFEGAKETIEQFCENCCKCFALTKRGFISNDEVSITKIRLLDTGLISKTSEPRILGLMAYVNDKYQAIEKIYKEYFKTDIDKDNTILIDDDMEQITMCAANGINTILFAPDIENISLEIQDFINKFKISVAHSWDDIREIILNKELGEEKQ